MRNLSKFFPLFILNASPLWAQAAAYKIDPSPLLKHGAEASLYFDLQKIFDRSALTIEQHQQRTAVLQSVIQLEPEWIDGYWLLGAEHFMLASAFTRPGDYGKAEQHLDSAQSLTEKCLERQPRQILCKFFLASVLAKKSSLQGILASLRYGPKIHSLWNEVLLSGQEFWFRPNASLKGSVRYGLGLFYRLVPDRWLVERMFSIRGNLGRSIALHREGLQLNPRDPCSRLMLGVALLCEGRRRDQLTEQEEAQQILESVGEAPVFDVNQAHCQADMHRVRSEPTLACGYTQAVPLDEKNTPS